MRHLGIFLNSTDSFLKLKINENNYNQLYKNFDFVLIDDIGMNEHAEKLKEFIGNKKDQTYLYKISFSNNNLHDDFNIQRILKILNYKIEYDKYDYITLINNNYIFCDSLIDYFRYVDEHSYDFYSYTDSSENTYHYQLYLFTIKTTLLKNFTDILKTKNNIPFTLHSYIEKRMVYLKIAYLEDNLYKNIFYNDEYYEYLVKNNFLKIININKLGLFTYDETSNYLYPEYIRKLLKEANLLEYYDVPDDFDVYIYKKKNQDLNNFKNRELILHWIDNGRNENRKYF